MIESHLMALPTIVDKLSPNVPESINIPSPDSPINLLNEPPIDTTPIDTTNNDMTHIDTIIEPPTKTPNLPQMLSRSKPLPD